MSRVLDSEWHHGQWQAMTQADRIFHTALRWLLVLLTPVLDSEWHHGQWQAMTQADRIFHTALRWLLVLLIGTCTGLLAFLVNLAVEAIGGAKFGLVFSHIKGQNFLGGFLVMAATNLGLVLVSTCLCNGIAMEAVGSGIPEVKGYLNGVSTPAVLSAKTLLVKVKGYLNGVSTPAVLSAKTLLVKALGSIAAVAGGLAVGKEGPLVHCGACIASILGRLSHWISARRDLSRPRKPRIPTASSIASLGLFNHGSIKALRTPVWLHSDRGLRDLVTCGAASGVAAAFLAPVGGVLFALEQVTSCWRNSLIWHIFFTNAVVPMLLPTSPHPCPSSSCPSPHSPLHTHSWRISLIGHIFCTNAVVAMVLPAWRAPLSTSPPPSSRLVPTTSHTQLAQLAHLANLLHQCGGSHGSPNLTPSCPCPHSHPPLHTHRWRNSLIWRIFFTNAVVAMVLRACISLCEGDRCGGSFGSRGFILFDRSKSRTDFGLLEVVPAALLGVVGGLLGGLFNHLNVKLCAYRKNRLHR
ncbi:unnamed protein product [Closterium sp. Naga37s-1]|nr:unnamed protein product [Closterium sp. Naga37s-1]